MFIFRLNARSFGDLALDAIFLEQLPDGVKFLPVYTPLIKFGKRKTYANKKFVKIIFEEAVNKSGFPKFLILLFNIIFQFMCISLMIVHEVSYFIGISEKQRPPLTLRKLFGRKQLFETLKNRDPENIFRDYQQSELKNKWWLGIGLPENLTKSLSRTNGRVAVFHHRSHSNGGVLSSEVSAFKLAAEALLQRGFTVVRLTEPQNEVLFDTDKESYFEIDVSDGTGDTDLYLLRNSSLFFGSSSGPVWVSLYFRRPTLQLDYTDHFLNGPFLPYHYIAPANIHCRETGKQKHIIDLMNSGIKGHVFGHHMPSSYRINRLNNKQVEKAVKIFCGRIQVMDSPDFEGNMEKEKQFAQTRENIVDSINNADEFFLKYGDVADWKSELIRIRLTCRSFHDSIIDVNEE